MTAADRLQSLASPVVAQRDPATPTIPAALALDLLAAVLAAGVPVTSALDALADALGPEDAGAAGLRDLGARMLSGRAGSGRPASATSLSDAPGRGGRRARAGFPGTGHPTGSARPTGATPLVDALGAALTLATRAGLPPAELIRAAARRERARGAATQRAAIRRLEVLLVVPAGLCLLPAFVLIGVVPVVIALLSG